MTAIWNEIPARQRCALGERSVSLSSDEADICRDPYIFTNYSSADLNPMTCLPVPGAPSEKTFRNSI